MAKRISRRRVLGAAAVGAAAAVGSPYLLRPRKREHIILIVADAMRGDKIGRVVNGMEVTPNLNRLAGESLFFPAAYSPASWTKPSMASILSGRYAPYHGVESGPRALPEMETIQSFLKAQGYYTLALQTNPWLKAEITETPEEARDITWGFSANFDFYLWKNLCRLSDRKETMNAAYAYAADVANTFENLFSSLATADKPVFAYLHFMDTHQPWLLEEPTAMTGRFHKRETAARLGVEGVYVQDVAVVKKLFFEREAPTAEDIEVLRGINDEAAAYVDGVLGDLLDRLERRRELDNTTIIFTSDHGDELWEHGQLGHGLNLFSTTLHVPLIIKRHKSGAGTFDRYVSNTALLETVKAWFGRGDADSLTPPLEAPGREAVFAGSAAAAKVILPDGRAVIDKDGEAAFFDIRKDPGEFEPLAPDEEALERLDRMRTFLRQSAAADGIETRLATRLWQRKVRQTRDGTFSVEDSSMESQEREQLRALGYLGR